MTLGLVLDGSGFVRRSETFEGNVSEGKTLERMLNGLGAPTGALVVMDAGIATEANLIWLSEHGYRYWVVSRERARQFEAETAIPIETAAGATAHIQRVDDPNNKEVRLYCHSEQRELKEQGINQRFCERFEAGLKNIADGLSKPRTEKRLAKLHERSADSRKKARASVSITTSNTCSSPYWPTNSCKSFAGNCKNMASRDAGAVCRKFCPCNSGSQRPYGVLMAAPCISAKPRVQKRSWRPFTKP